MKYVITGSSSGLGFALAKQLVAHGDVIGVSRRKHDLGNSRLPYDFKFIKADLSKNSSVIKNSQFISKLKSSINVEEFTLIINAGVFYSNSKRLNSSDREKLFNVNLFSVMEIVEQLKNLNLKRILFINSISGIVGQAEQHEYVASKHALMGYVRSLIKEGPSKPYDVISINPGGIDTELWADYPNVNTQAFLKVDELARLIVNLVLIEQRVFIPSLVILPEGDL